MLYKVEQVGFSEPIQRLYRVADDQVPKKNVVQNSREGMQASREDLKKTEKYFSNGA